MNFSILRFDLIGSPRGSKTATSTAGVIPLSGIVFLALSTLSFFKSLFNGKEKRSAKFRHKKTACLTGAEYRLWFIRFRRLEQITICLIKIIMKKPLGCQGAYIYFIAYLHIEVIKDQAYLAFDFVLYYLQKAFYLLAP